MITFDGHPVVPLPVNCDGRPGDKFKSSLFITDFEKFLPAKTEFTCKFKGCNMVFSFHCSLRNHVAEKIITSEADLTTTRRSTMLSRLKNVEKRRPPPLLIFSTKLLHLNQSRKLKVQTTRETNRNAYGAQKNEMMQMETDGSFVITVVISITCNARCCSTRKTNIMISISKVKSFIVTNVNLDSEHFHC